MKRISVDIGGTFTDCFVAWDDIFVQSKALTTHHNLSVGFNSALDQACKRIGKDAREVLGEVDSVRYATTLGTNALIERSGPIVGVLVTAGFESTVPLSRGRGYGEGMDSLSKNDLSSGTRPIPLVPQRLIRSLRERVSYSGEILMDLSVDDVRLQLKELIDAGAQALVVSLTNATENPSHERLVQEIFLREYPAHQLGALPMLLSHQLSGRKGEYVRTTTTIIDAYLHSTMYHALSDLEQNLRANGYDKPMLVSHNTGGMAQLNSTDALQTIHSGPVAGIAASEHLASEVAIDKMIATDMGGTSFDIGLITLGAGKHYDFMPVIDRWLVSIPMIRLVTLGAGGGSIASWNSLHDSVQVGPSSAGSDPGPASYDRGGIAPTVTDADLILGYLDPDRYAGGQIPLNISRARFAIEEAFEEYLSSDAVEVALLIKAEVDDQMANGMGKELRIRGYLPQEFTMVAYGGNGPLHCCGIADRLGITKILAPPFSSVFSALGAGNTNQMHIHERTMALNLFSSSTRQLFGDYDLFNSIVADLESRGSADIVRQGMDPSKVEHRVELDMRYGNQLVTLAVVVDRARMTCVGDTLAIADLFSQEYARRYGEGSQSPEAGIRISTVRVASFISGKPIAFGLLAPSGELTEAIQLSTRMCRFPGYPQLLETKVFNQSELRPNQVIYGPAIVSAESTTYLVEPTWRIETGDQGAVWFYKNENPEGDR